MRAYPRCAYWDRGQGGFTMVEMLMTAFILAIGILGLSMLQAMSMKATRGSRSLSTAVVVGEHLMDRVEMQGRLSWLNLTDSTKAAPSLGNFNPGDLKYIALKGPFSDYFDINGNSVAGPAAFFTVTTTRTDSALAATGAISDYTVQVQFQDQVDRAKAPIVRTVTLTRRVLHG